MVEQSIGLRWWILGRVVVGEPAIGHSVWRRYYVAVSGRRDEIDLSI